MRRRIEEEGATCIYLEEAEDDDNEWDCGDHRSSPKMKSSLPHVLAPLPISHTRIKRGIMLSLGSNPQFSSSLI